MPYTRRNIKHDVDDIGAQFGGPQGIEFRAATKPLGLEASALTFQRIPPGCRFPFGHAHTRQEETYVVVRGSGRMNLDGEIIEVGAWNAVRVSPATWRGYEAGPEGLEVLVIGAPNLGDDPRQDVDGERAWWGER